MAAPDREENVAPAPANVEDVAAEVLKSDEGLKAEAEDAVPGINVSDQDSAAIAVEPSLPSFKEESYFVADLKDSEKKALQDFKLRVETAIKEKEFLASDKPEEREADIINVEMLESGSISKHAEAVLAEEQKVNLNSVTEETPAEATPQADAMIAMEVNGETALIQTQAADASVSLFVGDEHETNPRSEKFVDVGVTKAAEPVLALEDLSLWGIPLLHSKGDERTNVLLLKFLRARDFNVKSAFTMLKNTVRWRHKFGADGLVHEDLGCDELEKVAYMCGFDKHGHPVCLNNFGSFQDKQLYHKTFGDQTKISRFLRWRVQLLERSIQQLTFSPGGANAMIQIIDLKSSPWPAKKELRLATSQALALLQDNYPEMVVKNILVNAPWYFTALYSMISPFLTRRTKSKFVVAGGGKVAETLFKFVSPEYVPVEYGGLGRPKDAEFLGVEAPVTTLIVKAGEKKTIELPVAEQSGGNVLWDVAVAGWDIIYGAEYIPSQVCSYVTIIEKSNKIPSQGEPLRNAFKASEPGKVVLTLDNVSSRRKRIVHYRYVINDILKQSS